MNHICRLMSFNMLKTTASSCCHFLRTAPTALRYYNAVCDGWIVSNKGCTMSTYDIPAMVGIAFSRAMTPGNILSGFKVSSVFPFDRHIFPDSEFLSSDVTDRPDPGIADAAVPAINEGLPTGDHPSIVDALPSGDEHVTSGAIAPLMIHRSTPKPRLQPSMQS